MDGADWLRGQLSAFACSACGRTYVADHIRVLAQRDDLFFVDLACQMCGAEAVAIVTVQVDDSQTARIDVGDLAEAPPVVDGPPSIDADDVIDMHRFLLGFDGDFAALFGPDGNPPNLRGR